MWIRPSRIVLILGVVAGLAWCLGPVSLAADKDKGGKSGKDFFQGKPEGYKPGNSAHFYVWHSDGIWHLRTTTAKQRHRFQGLIQVQGGVLTDLKVPNGEALGPNSDRIAWNKDRTAILFDFVTDGGADGVDFKVHKKTDQLIFTLSIDGKPAPQRIEVGRKGRNPDTAKFVLPAHP
jgi:hypothetical protein